MIINYKIFKMKKTKKIIFKYLSLNLKIKKIFFKNYIYLFLFFAYKN